MPLIVVCVLCGSSHDESDAVRGIEHIEEDSADEQYSSWPLAVDRTHASAGMESNVVIIGDRAVRVSQLTKTTHDNVWMESILHRAHESSGNAVA
jgi:hypothetical protein